MRVLFGKIKRKSEFLTEGATIAAVNGVDPVNLYSTFDESGDDVVLTVWFDLGGASFLNSAEHPDQFAGAQQLLNKYAIELNKASIKKQVSEEKNKLKKLESDYKKLNRDHKRYVREIEQAKEKIKKAEANIETNLIEQEEKEKQIEAQKTVIEIVKKKLEDL